MRLTGAFQGLDGPFEHQGVVLSRLINRVFELLGVDSPLSRCLPDTLVLRRRIQVQGRAPSGNIPIPLEAEAVHGDREPCSPLDIGLGDLVQALVSFDIVLARGEDGLPRTHVFLCPERITRLWSSPLALGRVVS